MSMEVINLVKIYKVKKYVCVCVYADSMWTEQKYGITRISIFKL